MTRTSRLLEKIEAGHPMIQNKTGSDMPMCANVNMYSGLVYTMLGIPRYVHPPLCLGPYRRLVRQRIEEVLTCHRIMRPAYRAMVKQVHYEPMSARPGHYAPAIRQPPPPPPTTRAGVALRVLSSLGRIFF